MSTTAAQRREVANILNQHAGMTDRSATDGCRCGSPEVDEGDHQAGVLAAAGLLARPLPTYQELWQAIVDIRDAHPRVTNDASTDEIVDALLTLLAGDVK